MICRWYHSHEVLLDDIFVIDESHGHIFKYHSLIFQFLSQTMVNHFAIILSSDTCEDGTLSLRDPKSLKGLFDALWDIIP